MAANTRLATATQILCVIAYKGPGGTTAEVVSRSLRTNPVVVRRMLKSLERQGLVEVRPGKDGGVQLARTPDQITLLDIHRAVDTDSGVFALRPGRNRNCPVDSSMRELLTPVFGAADSAVESTLSRTTLGGLLDDIG